MAREKGRVRAQGEGRCPEEPGPVKKGGYSPSSKKDLTVISILGGMYLFWMCFGELSCFSGYFEFSLTEF